MVARIPFVDLGAQHREVAEEVVAGFAEVMDATAFVQGEAVGAFEAAFARYCGTGHCVGVANGTDALEIALRALGVGSGDEVVVPANTFVATVEAVVRAGASPVLTDCRPDTLLLDTDAAAAACGPRTAAVVPVHLYGLMVDPVAVGALAGAHGLAVVEDAAQAQGARHGHLRAGSVGDAAATSFYPGKNLGAYGDAGAVLTSDAALAERMRRIGNHGGTAKYEHVEFGFNSRLDTLQAVVLSAKLDRLDAWNRCRREAADRYSALLADVDGVRTPTLADRSEPVWHLYVVRVADRDRVLAGLDEAGIGAGVHYPAPVHHLAPFRDLATPGGFPVAEAAAREVLSLPMHPHITPADQECVVDVLAGLVS